MSKKVYIICPKCKEVSEGEGWRKVIQLTKYYEYENPFKVNEKPSSRYIDDVEYMHKDCPFSTIDILIYAVEIDIENKNFIKYGSYWVYRKEEANKIIYEYLNSLMEDK